jgi:hypothetical protein
LASSELDELRSLSGKNYFSWPAQFLLGLFLPLLHPRWMRLEHELQHDRNRKLSHNLNLILEPGPVQLVNFYHLLQLPRKRNSPRAGRESYFF